MRISEAELLKKHHETAEDLKRLLNAFLRLREASISEHLLRLFEEYGIITKIAEADVWMGVKEMYRTADRFIVINS